MTAFTELEWHRLDMWALLVGRGIVTVEEKLLQQCSAWLSTKRYETVTLEFSRGVSPAMAELGRLLRWEEQFGRAFDPTSRDIDLLRGGFLLNVPAKGGLVLCLQDFEQAWSEEEEWSRRFLGTLSDYSLCQLALARRFFAIIPIPDPGSRLVGQRIEELTIPLPFRFWGKAG